MKPTLEEVKQIALVCGLVFRTRATSPSNAIEVTTANMDELQAFAQHYKEEGRKEQKAIDEVAAVRIKFPNHALLSHAEAHIWDIAAIAARDAIRNNTGE